tara:strand:- start:29 stop:415 length:387 start_codon:yes stop_codon:yes gene_type:complete
MSNNSDNFLFGCKSLYFLSIHPFDFDKKNRKEYVELVDLGKLVLEEEGIQVFLGYLLEYQYRVSVWASMIALEYGKPNPNEMLQLNKNITIIDACLDCIMKDEIEPLSAKIITNKKNWAESNVPQQRI